MEPEAPATKEFAEAQRRYEESARTNRIKLEQPLHTNAPCSQARLRAAALAGDGYAASLCQGSNRIEGDFWLGLASTNGCVPAQIELAKRLEGASQVVFQLRVTNEHMLRAGRSGVRGTNGAVFEISCSADMTQRQLGEMMHEEIPGTEFVRWIGRAPGENSPDADAAKYWRNKAKAGLPKLKGEAATNDARALFALSRLHEAGDLVESNSVVAADMLRKAANLGLAAAECEWGTHNERLTNLVQASRWYLAAATQGLATAQRYLAVLNESPRQNPYLPPYYDPHFQPEARECARWNFEVASQLPPDSWTYYACCELGRLYASGEGVESSAVEVLKWYRRAIDMGGEPRGFAEYRLALCYFGGEGVPQDDNEGLKWVQKAVEKGYRENRGYEVGMAARVGQSGDYRRAVKYWRKLAVQGSVQGQWALWDCYREGKGVPKDQAEATRWQVKSLKNPEAAKVLREPAEDGNAFAQWLMGWFYAQGQGVSQDFPEAVKWYRKAAEQGYAKSQLALGRCYLAGEGVATNRTEAIKWVRKAAEQGNAGGQGVLGMSYALGTGVPINDIEAYKWLSLALAQNLTDDSREMVAEALNSVQTRMSREEIVEAQRLAAAFVPRPEAPAAAAGDNNFDILSGGTQRLKATATGFFITEDGFLVTNEHVVNGGSRIRVLTAKGLFAAKVVKMDAANDLALLKAEGRFAALPVAASRSVRMGSTVATVGFPNIGLQGFAPKLAKGEIASLTGAQDDPRHFQISAPVQPGNSGGALVDERGNVVGVVAAKLSAKAAMATSGALPENVNYAVKSSFLLSFLESMPEVAAKLREPGTKQQAFESMVKSVEQAAALVLVY